MNRFSILLILLVGHLAPALAQAHRGEAEYYLKAYSEHYGVPVDFARAIVEQESGWHLCVTSSKGAVGLMQLMPGTATRLGVKNRCDIRENISGGIRHLAWLMGKFHDLRLVAAAYYAGEHIVQKRGLKYSNADVVNYVAAIRQKVERQKQVRGTQSASRRTR